MNQESSQLTVSVVIPVYNGERFIGRAIESVLAQSYPAAEIIVVNDGSTDGTSQVLSGFGPKVRVVTIANGGVSNARNVGMAQCRGECLAFLDADDVWLPQKLEKQVNVFARYPDVSFCCCDYSVYDSYRRETVNHFTVLKGKNFNYNEPLMQLPFQLLLDINFVGTASTVFLRKSLMDQVGMFNTAYKQAEDFELWLRCAMATNFIVLSDVLVEKKVHTTNLTNNLKESYSCHMAVLKDVKVRMRDYMEQKSLLKAYAASESLTQYKLGDVYYNEGAFNKAFGHYWQALCSCPTVANFLRYLVVVSKKSLRLLSCGLISRKTLEKFRS